MKISDENVYISLRDGYKLILLNKKKKKFHSNTYIRKV